MQPVVVFIKSSKWAGTDPKWVAHFGHIVYCYNRIILYSVIMSKNVKKYNPEDYKDAEFITIGDGPIRIQIVNAENLSAGHIATMVEKLFRIYSEMGLVKTIAEEQAK